MSTGLHTCCGCASRGPFTLSGTERKYERSRPFAVCHLALSLDVDFQGKAVSGTATLDFERRAPKGQMLSLDAVSFEIRGVTLALDGGASLTLQEGQSFEYDGDRLDVHIPDGAQTGQLTVDYRVVPQLGLYFLEPDAEVPARPKQLWSQCQDEDGRHWFPCQDKPHVKMTSEMRVRVPAGMSVLSGGELIEKSTPSGEEQWLYHFALDEPTPAYLLTLVVGEFDEWEEEVALPSGKKIPLRYLVPVGRKGDGRRAFDGTSRMIELFSDTIGVDYPWQRYSQIVVSDFIFGGMENTTATTMYEHILLDKKATLDIESHDLVAHELAHQWFGDLVTCRDWSHAWLNEGFATYMELVERQSRLGQDEYEEGVTVDLNAYLSEAQGDYKRAIVCRDYDEPIDLFDRHLYQKGGLVLHLLRTELGDECFWGGVRSYLEQHRGSIVETNDLMRALEESSGLSLEAFFDQWVYRPGHPELTVKVGYEGGLLAIDVEQTQKGHNVATFHLPFEVEVTVNGETVRHRRDITEKKSSLVVRTEKRPDLVIIDPDYRLAAPVKLSAPADHLRRNLAQAPKARSRKMAALSLAKRHDPTTISALGDTLSSEEESWIVRAAAARALGKIRGTQARKLLTSAAKSPQPKVRRAAALALGNFHSDAKIKKALVRLTGDDSYLVKAASARSLGKVSTDAPAESSKLLQKLLASGTSWADSVQAGALDGIASSGDEASIDLVMEWTSYGKPLRARRTAISALARLGEGKKVRKHLTGLLDDRDPHTRRAVLGALEALGDAKARGPIAELVERELDGRVIRKAREVLTKLGADGSAGLRQAREANQKLEKQLAEIKTRLSKLEQAQKTPSAPTPPSAAPPSAAPPSPAAPPPSTGTPKVSQPPSAANDASTKAAETAPGAKKTTAKKSVAKTAAKKSVAKKAPSRLSAKKAPAKKAPAKKAPAKSIPKKTAAKKTAAKKTAAKKTAAKPAAKKTAAKKSSSRRGK